MLAIAFTVGLLALSLLLGWLISRWHPSRRWPKVVLSALLAVLIPIVSLVGYFLLGSTYPTSDAVQPNATDYRISVYRGPVPPVAIIENHPIFGRGASESKPIARFAETPICVFALRAPSSVHLGDDFSIQVFAFATASHTPTVAKLNAPSDWKVRAVDQCAGSKGTDICVNPAAGGSSGRWIFRSNLSGRADWIVTLKPGIDQACDKPWHASLSRNDRLLIRSVDGEKTGHEQIMPERGGFNSSAGYNFPYYSVVYIGANDPVHDIGIQVDLNKGQLVGTTDIQQTLGVSDATYGWLVIGGAIFSSALGSGWLLQLIAFAKRSRT